MAHPRQKTEIVLLAFAVIVLLLAAAVFFLSRQGPPPVATAKPPASAEQPEEPTAETPVELGGPLRPSTRDPFGAPSSAREPGPTPGAPAPPAPPPTAPGAPPPPSAAAEELVLTGIMTGPPQLAVIRRGQKRYIVAVGDPVDEGYTVKAIGEKRVLLSKGPERLVLRLGQAEAPAAPPERTSR